jgi:PEP-CTERM motif-containing protein
MLARFLLAVVLLVGAASPVSATSVTWQNSGKVEGAFWAPLSVLLDEPFTMTWTLTPQPATSTPTAIRNVSDAGPIVLAFDTGTTLTFSSVSIGIFPVGTFGSGIGTTCFLGGCVFVSAAGLSSSDPTLVAPWVLEFPAFDTGLLTNELPASPTNIQPTAFNFHAIGAGPPGFPGPGVDIGGGPFTTPLRPVPEPSTVGLLLIGLAVVLSRLKAVSNIARPF